jgi:putative FmdB family regulatory protein
MPTYAYRCTSCSHEFEAIQKFSEQPISECPACGQHTRRVFHPVGIVFKGSGWYVNDSRSSANAEGDGGKAKVTAERSDSSAGKPAAAESKPAAAPAAAD